MNLKKYSFEIKYSKKDKCFITSIFRDKIKASWVLVDGVTPQESLNTAISLIPSCEEIDKNIKKK